MKYNMFVMIFMSILQYHITCLLWSGYMSIHWISHVVQTFIWTKVSGVCLRWSFLGQLTNWKPLRIFPTQDWVAPTHWRVTLGIAWFIAFQTAVWQSMIGCAGLTQYPCIHGWSVIPTQTVLLHCRSFWLWYRHSIPVRSSLHHLISVIIWCYELRTGNLPGEVGDPPP